MEEGLSRGWSRRRIFTAEFGRAEKLEEGSAELLRHETVKRKVDAATEESQKIHKIAQRIVHCLRKTVATESTHQQ